MKVVLQDESAGLFLCVTVSACTRSDSASRLDEQTRLEAWPLECELVVSSSFQAFQDSISRSQTVGGHVIQYLCYFFSSFVKAKGVFYDGFLWRRAIREFRGAWRQGKKVNYYLRPMSKLIARLRWGNSNKALSLAYIEQIMILLFVLQE